MARPGQPYLISNLFKKIQYFFRTCRGTGLVSLVSGHAWVLKKLRMKSLHRTDGQTNAAHFTIRKAQLVQETSVNLIEENLSNFCQMSNISPISWRKQVKILMRIDDDIRFVIDQHT